MFENNLRYARETLEMTQAELGYIFGVSDAAIRSWESARDFMPLPKLVKFCNMYNYSLDYICGFTRYNKHYKKIEIDKTNIANRLKQFRKEMKLSQQEFTDKCQIAQTTYSGYETGKYLINSTNLYYICKTFHISMDYIIGRKNSKNI